jgi:hypothetical protein
MRPNPQVYSIFAYPLTSAFVGVGAHPGAHRHGH